MENSFFSEQGKTDKINKLKRVILSKMSDVSEDNLQVVLEEIDIDKQHFVKATRKAERFLNIITEEDVCRPDERVKSYCKVLYGSCFPGKFEDVYGERNVVRGWLDESLPAAAFKKVLKIDNKNFESVERVLVIYEPMVKH